jgi:hypothetical protein
MKNVHYCEELKNDDNMICSLYVMFYYTSTNSMSINEIYRTTSALKRSLFSFLDLIIPDKVFYTFTTLTMNYKTLSQDIVFCHSKIIQG